MKVVIASTVLPFTPGGGSLIVDWLQEMLVRNGHQAEVFHIPFTNFDPELLDQMFALRLFDLSRHGDRLIAIRPPAYLLRHPNKVLWFIHHMRGAYDLWGTAYHEFPDTPQGRRYRRAIFSADNIALREARNIYTNSQVVSARLKRFNGLDGEPLYPPLLDPERYHSESYGDYILYVGRIVSHKRQHLAVEALAYTRTPVRLVIAGPGTADGYEQKLRATAARRGIGDRVQFLTEWIPDSLKIDLFARCLAAVYVPFDEDSYGYVSLEAQHSAKAVITATDSGGTHELIADGENGFVAEPSPRALAAVMDRLYEDRRLARQSARRDAPNWTASESAGISF